MLNDLRDAAYRNALMHGLYESDEKRNNESTDRGYSTTLHRLCARRVMDEVREMEDASADEAHFAEEWADSIITLLSIAGRLGIDADGEVKRKMEINRSRPWMHGKTR